jgi:uncharacterized protein (DUF1501 family)
MPAPAGTGMSRRSFLLRSAGVAAAVYGAGRLAGLRVFEDGVAEAAAGPAGSVLLTVFLEGGCDGMSVLAPVGDPAYRKLRPTLGLAEGAGRAFAEDPRLQWHPAASALADLHGEGKVSVLPAVGYAHPDQSHFVSRHFWEVGALDARLQTGWLGRLLDQIGTADNPLQGVSLDDSLAPPLAASRVPVAAVAKPEDFDFWMPGAWGPPADLGPSGFTAAGRAHLGARDRDMAQAARAAAFAGGVRDALAPFGKDGKPTYTPQASYPVSEEPFPARLAGFAAMLGGGLPIRAATIEAPGAFDTHANQADTLPGALKLTCDSLLAFQRDIEARGLADRVLTLVWTEFGRRAEENGSGTDHGAAGAGFLIGTRAAGRMIGEFPGLDRLDADGNLVATADFRGLYGALTADWFGVDPAAVLPGAAGIGRPVILR